MAMATNPVTAVVDRKRDPSFGSVTFNIPKALITRFKILCVTLDRSQSEMGEEAILKLLEDYEARGNKPGE
jgi:hypothetical protein